MAVGLTLSWGCYAFLKRTLPIGPAQGFFLEVVLLSLPALAFVAWLAAFGQGHFAVGNSYDTTMLACAGFVTAIPLILYANGAKGLRLSTIGIMQYIAPTLIFLVAVFVFGEPFSSYKAVAFSLDLVSAVDLHIFADQVVAQRARLARNVDNNLDRGVPVGDVANFCIAQCCSRLSSSSRRVRSPSRKANICLIR